MFNVSVVKECLKDNDKVFTVRSYKSYDKFRVVVVDDVDYLCERVKQVFKPQDLNGFVELSGFNNANSWWNKIRGFGAVGGYLYKVSLL